MSAYRNSAQSIHVTLQRIHFRRGLAFGVIIIGALIAFEMFNYSTTEYALTDLLGGLKFLGLPWATILAIAFCGIDFAGIARLITPEEGTGKSLEVWYLFGAWLLAATMNAMLTWWGVSLAIANHSTLGNAVVERQTLLHVVPVFVAVLVWLIRVLIIGTYSTAGTRLLTQSDATAATINHSIVNNTSRPSISRHQASNVISNNGTISPSGEQLQGASTGSDERVNTTNARQDPVYTAIRSAQPARISPTVHTNTRYPIKTGNSR